MEYISLEQVLYLMKQNKCTVTSRMGWIKKERAGQITPMRSNNKNKRNRGLGDRIFTKAMVDEVLQAFSHEGSGEWHYKREEIEQSKTLTTVKTENGMEARTMNVMKPPTTVKPLKQVSLTNW